MTKAVSRDGYTTSTYFINERVDTPPKFLWVVHQLPVRILAVHYDPVRVQKRLLVRRSHFCARET
jgi:hypothetical protein